MCWEDIAIGRMMKGGFRSLQLTTASLSMLSPSPTRSLIVLNPPSQGRVTYSIAPRAVDLLGIVLTSGDAPVVLDIKKHGDLVTRGWQAIGVAGVGRLLRTWDDAEVVDNGAATAVVGAVEGETHVLDHADFSFEDVPAAFVVATVTFGALVATFQTATFPLQRIYPQGFFAADNQAITVVLGASGTPGINGNCNANGRTFISSSVGTVVVQSEDLVKPEGMNHATSHNSQLHPAGFREIAGF